MRSNKSDQNSDGTPSDSELVSSQESFCDILSSSSAEKWGRRINSGAKRYWPSRHTYNRVTTGELAKLVFQYANVQSTIRSSNFASWLTSTNKNRPPSL